MAPEAPSSLQMKYYVYILFSPESRKYYVGQTNNFEARIERHNSGCVRSTKNHIPWQLLVKYECCSRSEAMQLETKIKKRGIARYLKDNDHCGCSVPPLQDSALRSDDKIVNVEHLHIS